MVLFIGLQYDVGTLGSSVQTLHPGGAGPVSDQLGGAILTGCFFF